MHGVSLPEQREAISRYAQQNQLTISRWFEEQESAAKQGRPVFDLMLKLLMRRAAAGVIIHKIDRSARNIQDWAEVDELLNRGIEVYFANERLDLTSRGGRLAADIQAVVASDYSRNLRDEVKKGFYGRLKQGFYPMQAPAGYLDNGAATPKTPDPAAAPFVRQAFELYSTGRFTLAQLSKELWRMGLRRKDGGAFRKNRLSKLLNNPFYFGLIRIKKTGQYFAGLHQPLISKRTFDRVQTVLAGKLSTRTKRHDFLYRRRLTCKSCEYSLIGETAKGFVYYRCHTSSCPTTCLREEIVNAEVLRRFGRLQFSPLERRYLQQELERMRGDSVGKRQEMIAGLRLQLSQTEERLNRLTDAYIDRLIELDLFEARKKALLAERLDLGGRITEWQNGKRDVGEELAKFIERADSACLAYKGGPIEEKRELLDSLTSNRLVDEKLPTIMLKLPYSVIATRTACRGGGAAKNTHRTCTTLLSRLIGALDLGDRIGACLSAPEGSAKGRSQNRIHLPPESRVE
jgi:DNA invertase Pin-like site-specific DNA recombinase